MSFSTVYYIINSWPSAEKTIEMVDKYVEHGARGIQICLPSQHPYGESEFIQERMAHAIRTYGLNYDLFMNTVREIRRRHPKLEFHQVLYDDVVKSIGLEKFADYCLEVGTHTVMVDSNETAGYLNSRGIVTTDFIHYDMPEEMIVRAAKTGNLVMLRSNSRKELMTPRDGMTTWAERIAYLRGRGVKGPIYCVAGIDTKEKLLECKQAGADGAYIGTALMHRWDNEPELWALLDEFNSVAED